MVTSNIIHRTFHINTGFSVATCFTIDVDEVEYIVTARHVAIELEKHLVPKLFFNNKWNELPIEIVGHAAGNVDISVLRSKEKLAPPGLPIIPSTQGLTYGEDVHFLGFPLGMMGGHILTDLEFPIPLVKKATVSSLPDDSSLFFLDGHNNRGFSGGPIVFMSDAKTTNVAGVISAYRFSCEPVFMNEKQTEYYLKDNTGIILAYDIREAIRIIENAADYGRNT